MWTDDNTTMIAYPNECIPLEGIVLRNKLTCVEYEVPIQQECGKWVRVSLEDLPPGDYVILYDSGVGLINSHYGDLKYYPPCPDLEAAP
jgi:hypothetical protein